MWTVICIAQVRETAYQLRTLLEQHEIIVKIKDQGQKEHEKNQKGCYEILVPSAEVGEAQDLIFESDLF